MGNDPQPVLTRPPLLNRYYDPTSQQFLSVDPDVAETGEPYAFTGNDPLNATDPLGLRWYRWNRTYRAKPKTTVRQKVGKAITACVLLCGVAGAHIGTGKAKEMPEQPPDTGSVTVRPPKAPGKPIYRLPPPTMNGGSPFGQPASPLGSGYLNQQLGNIYAGLQQASSSVAREWASRVLAPVGFGVVSVIAVIVFGLASGD